MSDFKTRLLDELKSLNDKIVKLEEFMAGSLFSGIDPHQQALLKVQLPLMQAYSQVLQERISLLS